MSDPRAPGEHLEVEDVVGFVTGSLSGGARERVERHLADCEACTAEVAEVARLRTPSRRLPSLVMPAAAAAAIVGLVLLGPALLPRDVGDPPVRGDEARAELELALPADGATVRGAPDFVWFPVRGATAYRVFVTSAAGDSVWSTTTSDTSVRAPALEHGGGKVFYWYVDVLLEDGRSMTGKVRELRMGP